MADPILNSDFNCYDGNGNIISTIQFTGTDPNNPNAYNLKNGDLQTDAPYLNITKGNNGAGMNWLQGQVVIIPFDTNSGYAFAPVGVGRANGNIDVTLTYNQAGSMQFTCDSMGGWFSWGDPEGITQVTYSFVGPTGTKKKGVFILQGIGAIRNIEIKPRAFGE